MSELTHYTVKDTGVKLLIKKVSPLLVMNLRRQFPQPEPHMQAVDLDGETKQEPNLAHPDYTKSLIEYNREMEDRIRRLLIKFGVVIPEDNTTWKDELEQYREIYKSEFGKDLIALDGKSDEVDWICYCALGTEADYEELYDAILRRSQPTTEVIEQAKSGFPGQISREER